MVPKPPGARLGHPALRATAKGLGEQGGQCLCQIGTHLGSMALELSPLSLPGGLGLGKLLLKLGQTSALVPEQPAQLLQRHLHVSQRLDVLTGL